MIHLILLNFHIFFFNFFPFQGLGFYEMCYHSREDVKTALKVCVGLLGTILNITKFTKIGLLVNRFRLLLTL